jgi:hypothetical protein
MNVFLKFNRGVKAFRVAIIFGLLAFGSIGFAYQSLISTGDMLSPGQYGASLETQFVTQNNSGANLVGRFDGAYSRDLNYRAELGFGSTDFHASGMVKWIPFPDVDKQPAIGLMGGLGYAQYDDNSEVSLKAYPLISKRFIVDIGEIVPYASLPIGIRSYGGETLVPVQFTAGSELKTLYFKDLTFFAEIGFNLSNSFSYISFAALYRFGDSTDSVGNGTTGGDVSGFN